MEMDVWHGYQSGSPRDCQKISLNDPFFVVTGPLRKLKNCGRELMVIRKHKRLGSQNCFYRMPMNNTDEESVRIFGVEEQTGEDVYQQVVDVVKETGVEICKTDISVCHCLPAKGQSGKPNIVKFVRRETKLALMKKKSGLRHQSGRPIYIDDDITQLRERLPKSLKEKPDVKATNMIREKKLVYQTNNDKVVFQTLHEVYKWDRCLVLRV